MDYYEFLNEVIEQGIAGAKKDYSSSKNPNHPLMLEGALAGFDKCRGLAPNELASLLDEARINSNRAFAEQLLDYWKHKCFEAEIEWTGNCISVILIETGFAPITQPTASAARLCVRIINGSKSETANENEH